MEKITDITLSCLDAYNPTSAQLGRLCALLLRIGSDYTELSVEAYRKIGSLPPSGRYILRCDSAAQMAEYPDFEAYIYRRSGENAQKNGISEIQMNDIREIAFLSNQYGGLPNVRIRGLDDIINYDYPTAFQSIRQNFSGRIQLCPENRYYCATAIAVEWLLEGGKEAAASFAGIGGHAALEEVFMALRLEVRRKPNADYAVFPQIKALIEVITNEPVARIKPVIGEDIFNVESGIHVDGILKNPTNYEPFRPELVGNSRKVVLGKHSGKASVKLKMKELGLEDETADLDRLLSAVRRKSIVLEQGLSDADFVRLCQTMSRMNGGGGR